MRIFVVAIALLAGLKIWTQDHMYRSAMTDAVIAAYRDRAVQSCRVQEGYAVKATINPWVGATPDGVRIGNPAAEVALWDVNNPEWEARFRHPYLIMTLDGDIPATCTYDLVAGTARIGRL